MPYKNLEDRKRYQKEYYNKIYKEQNKKPKTRPLQYRGLGLKKNNYADKFKLETDNDNYYKDTLPVDCYGGNIIIKEIEPKFIEEDDTPRERNLKKTELYLRSLIDYENPDPLRLWKPAENNLRLKLFLCKYGYGRDYINECLRHYLYPELPPYEEEYDE
jgi:hypothetical protein